MAENWAIELIEISDEEVDEEDVKIIEISNPMESVSKGQGDCSDILGGCAAPYVSGNDLNPQTPENSHASSAGEFGDFTSAFGIPAATSYFQEVQQYDTVRSCRRVSELLPDGSWSSTIRMEDHKIVRSKLISNPMESVSKGQGDCSDILGGCAAPYVSGNDLNPQTPENTHASSAGEFGDFTSAFGKPAATSYFQEVQQYDTVRSCRRVSELLPDGSWSSTIRMEDHKIVRSKLEETETEFFS